MKTPRSHSVPLTRAWTDASAPMASSSAAARRKVAETAAKAPVRIQERDYDPIKNKVRTVGPVFLPANESAIDLGRPADAGVN